MTTATTSVTRYAPTTIRRLTRPARAPVRWWRRRTWAAAGAMNNAAAPAMALNHVGPPAQPVQTGAIHSVPMATARTPTTYNRRTLLAATAAASSVATAAADTHVV